MTQGCRVLRRPAIGDRPRSRVVRILRGGPRLQGRAADVARLHACAAAKSLIALWRCGGTPVANPWHVVGRSASERFVKESHMNWDRIEGNWKQLTGKVKEQWGKLTDDDIDVIAGKRDQLVGKIQEQYGITKDEAEKQVDLFGGRFRDDDFRKYQ
jgi:uncharacterized protein YjbJ (UPF0337 family)